jgi:heme exporter protein D
MFFEASMGSFGFSLGYALAMALCSILLTLFVIFLCRRDLLLRAVKNLGTALVPFALALVLWPFIRWPSPYLKDEILLASFFVLALSGIVTLVVHILRSLVFRQ